ncbi:ABC transporter permease [Frigoriglobus tundricola]|uniref:ABC-type antimicrobial peptide transport system, permease component n=1 Tax=Frigoriglobus tundricola TaxID=2774151 RepID=A0A6M5YM58_9BACT|nr:ABC transporter permease [Frigoriglobus tundricola]QJW94674.1 ABC-type antimicrobial peptide transport system, permease component [Frigoriglobus tundricola]
MNFFPPTFVVAIHALRRNLVRSSLTTLGIVIGVGAVIAMVEIGQGSKSAVADSIQSLGANNLLVMPGQASSGGVSFGGGSTPTLTPGDADAIIREVQSAVAVAPVVRTRTQIIAGGKNWVPLYIYGTTSAFLTVRDWGVSDGRAFTPQEEGSMAGVCVVGRTIARELFGTSSPIGQTLRLNNTPLQIIGVLEAKGANTFGADQDDIVLAPWRTIKFKVSGQSAQTANQSVASAAGSTGNSQTRFPSQQPSPYPVQSATQAADFPAPPLPTFVDQILVRIGDERDIPAAIKQITVLLRERHRVQAGQPDDFNIRDTAELSSAALATSQLMSGLLLAVALISLVVGGVGIMNIMLVSVTERTKEIGLRMAVGARPKDILWQFLVEAVVLCLAGGALGILFGWFGSWLVRTLLHWRTEPSVPAVVASVGVSALVGVAFGFYPAWKASRLDPIDALRYE